MRTKSSLAETSVAASTEANLIARTVCVAISRAGAVCVIAAAAAAFFAGFASPPGLLTGVEKPLAEERQARRPGLRRNEPAWWSAASVLGDEAASAASASTSTTGTHSCEAALTTYPEHVETLSPGASALQRTSSFWTAPRARRARCFSRSSRRASAALCAARAAPCALLTTTACAEEARRRSAAERRALARRLRFSTSRSSAACATARSVTTCAVLLATSTVRDTALATRSHRNAAWLRAAFASFVCDASSSDMRSVISASFDLPCTSITCVRWSAAALFRRRSSSFRFASAHAAWTAIACCRSARSSSSETRRRWRAARTLATSF
mmetsp:Transcript_10320/g.33849  ORF Transcript_10320/g.33849 Transcript_10320/m.33849 type:complete len:327 (-) Transcript_10320:6147-7127(-)